MGVIPGSLVFAAPEPRGAVPVTSTVSSSAQLLRKDPMPTPILRADALITRFDGALTTTHGDR
jgi:hypothetical protein